MSEAELHILRGRLDAGKRNKARRGEYYTLVPTGYLRTDEGVVLEPDQQARDVASRPRAVALRASVAPAADGRLPRNGRSSFETHCPPTSLGSSGRRTKRNSGKTAPDSVGVLHAAPRCSPVLSSVGAARAT